MLARSPNVCSPHNHHKPFLGATGTIEIYTNDPTVNDSGPGYVRIPLTATAVTPNSDETEEDTGSGEQTEDTGSSETDVPAEETEDTGEE